MTSHSAVKGPLSEWKNPEIIRPQFSWPDSEMAYLLPEKVVLSKGPGRYDLSTAIMRTTRAHFMGIVMGVKNWSILTIVIFHTYMVNGKELGEDTVYLGLRDEGVNLFEMLYNLRDKRRSKIWRVCHADYCEGDQLPITEANFNDTGNSTSLVDSQGQRWDYYDMNLITGFRCFILRNDPGPKLWLRFIPRQGIVGHNFQPVDRFNNSRAFMITRRN